MCYAIPGKVDTIEGKYAIVDYFGEKKKAINEFDELKTGDYIYAQGGYVIKIVPPDEAHSILSTWKEVFFDLQETDLRLSHLDLEKKGINKQVTHILDRAAEGLELKEKDYLSLFNLTNKDELSLLYKTANFLRQKHLKNSCCVHGIIEFSNYCSENCAYCGIAGCNKDIPRYRMSKEEIVTVATEAVEKYGFQALVLQSGEDKYYSVADLCSIIKELKKRLSVLIFVSFGEVGIPGINKLYDAGARGLLMRFETSDQKLYAELHPDRTLQSRMDHLLAAYKKGYLLITGGLIGLPDQSYTSILKDIFFTKSINTEMYTFGPLIPHPHTPLAGQKPPATDDILKVIAIARLIDPENAKIVVTTGFETLDPKARELGLLAGANSVMINVTPMQYRRKYSIYPNRAHNDDSIQDQINETIALLRKLGRAPTDLSIQTQ